MKKGQDPWAVDEKDFPRNGTPAQKLRFLISYAILAPSGHNSQPWLFGIRNDAVEVFADRTRALPMVDPDDRELTVSCGAALESLCVAMRRFGCVPDVEVFPSAGESDLLARVGFHTGAEPSPDEAPLFAAIPQRRTVREGFADQAIQGPVLTSLHGHAAAFDVGFTVFTAAQERRPIAQLVAEGDRIQFADRRFRRELASWIHSRRGATRDGLSGAAFGMPDLLSSVGALVVRTFDLGHRVAAQDEEIAAGSPALALFSTHADTPVAWLAVGRALARVLLAATAAGIRASYLNQPIEVAELRPRLASVASVKGVPQLLLRLGYGPQPEPSARRPVEEVLV